MLVTLSGTTMEVSLLQLEKAYFPIVVISSGMMVFEQPRIMVLLVVSMIALQSLRESYEKFSLSIIIDMRLLQLKKARSPILVTLSGILIAVRLMQL